MNIASAGQQLLVVTAVLSATDLITLNSNKLLDGEDKKLTWENSHSKQALTRLQLCLSSHALIFATQHCNEISSPIDKTMADLNTARQNSEDRVHLSCDTEQANSFPFHPVATESHRQK